MGRSIQVRPVATAVALMALLALPASATALRKIDTPSKISIKSTELRFSGHVTTPSLPPCEEHRKVVLYKAVHNGPDEPVSSTTTDRQGAWSITVPGFAGISLTPFYAKVRRSSEGAAGTIYVCDGARSRTIKPSP